MKFFQNMFLITFYHTYFIFFKKIVRFCTLGLLFVWQIVEVFFLIVTYCPQPWRLCIIALKGPMVERNNHSSTPTLRMVISEFVINWPSNFLSPSFLLSSLMVSFIWFPCLLTFLIVPNLFWSLVDFCINPIEVFMFITFEAGKV